MNTTLYNEQSKSLIKSHKEKIATIKEVATSELFLQFAYTRDTLTKLRQKQLKSNDISLFEAKQFAITRLEKQHKAKLDDLYITLEHIYKSSDLLECTITIEWKKSKMWGNNPNAHIELRTKDLDYSTYSSGSVTGCGYDKESTAFANAINQDESFKKLLLKNRHKLKKNKCYGCSINEHFIGLSGGVGVSCYYGILNVCGYELKHITGTKTVDVYTITKKK